MKKSFLLLFILVIIAIILWFVTQNETVFAPTTVEESVNANYSNSKYKFSLTLPAGYTIEENYIHQISPTRNIDGVKFTIPRAISNDNNLGSDTAISIESIPNTTFCTAELFTDYPEQKPDTIIENGTTYSLITSSDAGAGNRYEESIYAIEGSNPCFAVRYFIHYSAIENYPEGTVKGFNKQSLLDEFNSIRRSLKLK